MITSALIAITLALSTTNHGLHATLELDRTTFPMGEPVAIRLLFDADSSLVEGGTILNQNDRAWTCSLVFRNAATGRTYERTRYDAGMSPACTRERFVMLGSVALVEEITVYLLSSNGEQIPPGRYRMHAIYENVGIDGGHSHPDPRFHPDAARLWTGSIASEPVTIEIEDAEPELVELLNPTRVTFKLLVASSQIAVHWDDHSAQRISVTRRPGYTVGHRYRVKVMIDGEESDYHPSGQGGRGWSTSGPLLMLPPDISKRVFTGAGLELVIEMEAFETSVPVAHAWTPEDGDFSILWRSEVRDSYR